MYFANNVCVKNTKLFMGVKSLFNITGHDEEKQNFETCFYVAVVLFVRSSCYTLVFLSSLQLNTTY